MAARGRRRADAFDECALAGVGDARAVRRYRANSTARVSLMTVTLIWPGILELVLDPAGDVLRQPDGLPRPRSARSRRRCGSRGRPAARRPSRRPRTNRRCLRASRAASRTTRGCRGARRDAPRRSRRRPGRSSPRATASRCPCGAPRRPAAPARSRRACAGTRGRARGACPGGRGRSPCRCRAGTRRARRRGRSGRAPSP